MRKGAFYVIENIRLLIAVNLKIMLVWFAKSRTKRYRLSPIDIIDRSMQCNGQLVQENHI